MKQVLMRFSEQVLSRNQMKSIRGGYEASGCTNDCGLLPSVSCKGTGCRTFEDASGGGCISDVEINLCMPI